LVTLVTRLVKSVTLPMTFCEKVCVPSATEAAKSEPGRRGTDGMDGEEVGIDDDPFDMEAGREKVGS
jgi:hypothetical protein